MGSCEGYGALRAWSLARRPQAGPGMELSSHRGPSLLRRPLVEPVRLRFQAICPGFRVDAHRALGRKRPASVADTRGAAVRILDGGVRPETGRWSALEPPEVRGHRRYSGMGAEPLARRAPDGAVS